MTYTLRQLTKAFAIAHPAVRSESGLELEKLIHVRGRNLRDKGLIRANHASAPGEHLFSDEDVAAACVALAMNLAGLPWAYIETMNYWLRPTSGSTRTDLDPFAFDHAIVAIKSGKKRFVTVAWSFDGTHLPLAWSEAFLHEKPHVPEGPNIAIVVPVNQVAKPVFDALVDLKQLKSGGKQ
ncbi:MAG: hypothetical protein ABJF50_06705 [Paracoccaceae bacterium]